MHQTRQWNWLACALAIVLAGGGLIAGQEPKAPKVKEPTAAQKKIAVAISGGHSYQKHVVDEKQFPDIKSQEEFGELIAKVIANATNHRELENGREAYYDKNINVIVIYNPKARDKGTCFKPSAGIRYFQNLK